MKRQPEPWMTNRQKVLAPKSGVFYCQCDLNSVGHYEKCSVCGRRMGRRRFKK